MPLIASARPRVIAEDEFGFNTKILLVLLDGRDAIVRVSSKKLNKMLLSVLLVTKTSNSSSGTWKEQVPGCCKPRLCCGCDAGYHVGPLAPACPPSHGAADAVCYWRWAVPGLVLCCQPQPHHQRLREPSPLAACCQGPAAYRDRATLISDFAPASHTTMANQPPIGKGNTQFPSC